MLGDGEKHLPSIGEGRREEMEGGSKGRSIAREGWELARILAIHLAQGRMHAPIQCLPAAVG